MCIQYGFYDECRNRLDEDPDEPESVFNAICDLFNFLPLAATVNDRILCLHSGISEKIKSLDDIAKIKKPYNPKSLEIISDILWSSPLGHYDYNNLTINLRKKTFDATMIEVIFGK
jgi:diadenosine tetraphosphatase ApaH/serine/threonine PP2A family protein phosphatase